MSEQTVSDGYYQVRHDAVRALYAAGWSANLLAENHGVSREVIYRVLRADRRPPVKEKLYYKRQRLRRLPPSPLSTTDPEVAVLVRSPDVLAVL